MNKGDLIAFVKQKTNLSKDNCEQAVNAVFEGISEALCAKENAVFVGFGSFVTVNRPERDGRNPRTGEKLIIKATRQVRFRPGKALKEALTK